MLVLLWLLLQLYNQRVQGLAIQQPMQCCVFMHFMVSKDVVGHCPHFVCSILAGALIERLHRAVDILCSM